MSAFPATTVVMAAWVKMHKASVKQSSARKERRKEKNGREIRYFLQAAFFSWEITNNL